MCISPFKVFPEIKPLETDVDGVAKTIQRPCEGQTLTFLSREKGKRKSQQHQYNI